MTKTMRFATVMTHNVYDCKRTKVNGRIGMVRRVDLRIGYIIDHLAQYPKINHPSDITDFLNASFNASYKTTDILHAYKRMKVAGLLTDDYKLTRKAKQNWENITKNLGSLLHFRKETYKHESLRSPYQVV